MIGLRDRLYRRPPAANANSAPIAITLAVAAAEDHAGLSSVVGTSGAVGRLYCSMSPRTRKIACVPPTEVSFGFQTFSAGHAGGVQLRNASVRDALHLLEIAEERAPLPRRDAV